MRKAAGHPTRERVYQFLVQYKLSHDGNSPTIREISEACGTRSTSVIWWHLAALEREGSIHRPLAGKRMACQIEIRGGKWSLESVKPNE